MSSIITAYPICNEASISWIAKSGSAPTKVTECPRQINSQKHKVQSRFLVCIAEFIKSISPGFSSPIGYTQASLIEYSQMGGLGTPATLYTLRGPGSSELSRHQIAGINLCVYGGLVTYMLCCCPSRPKFFRPSFNRYSTLFGVRAIDDALMYV
jgi:hypothetical protein